MCRVVSCVVGRGCLLWPVHSLGKTPLAFVLLHFVSQDQTCLSPGCLSTSYFCIPVPYDEKHIFFLHYKISDIQTKRCLLKRYSSFVSATAQSCLTLCDPIDCNLPGSSVHGIFQARILEWVAISFSRGSSGLPGWEDSQDWTCISCIAGRFFTTEPHGKLVALFFAFTLLNKPEMSSN